MPIKKGMVQNGDKCIVCEQELSSTTAARASHMRKHVRDGSLIESKNKDGKCEWKTTGKEPKSKTSITFISRSIKTKNYEPREPKIAKSKNNKIYIKCKKCKKFKKSRIFGDDRFVAADCECNVLTIFPKRMIEIMLKNPNKEYAE